MRQQCCSVIQAIEICDHHEYISSAAALSYKPLTNTNFCRIIVSFLNVHSPAPLGLQSELLAT